MCCVLTLCVSGIDLQDFALPFWNWQLCPSRGYCIIREEPSLKANRDGGRRSSWAEILQVTGIEPAEIRGGARQDEDQGGEILLAHAHIQSKQWQRADWWGVVWSIPWETILPYSPQKDRGGLNWWIQESDREKWIWVPRGWIREPHQVVLQREGRDHPWWLQDVCHGQLCQDGDQEEVTQIGKSVTNTQTMLALMNS